MQKDHLYSERHAQNAGNHGKGRKESAMRKAVIAVILLAILGVLILHLCPGIEIRLHHLTGWY